MFCCGLVAVLVVAMLGAWRWMRARPRLLVALLSTLLLAGPAALAVAWSGERATPRADAWALAMRAICGGHESGLTR